MWLTSEGSLAGEAGRRRTLRQGARLVDVLAPNREPFTHLLVLEDAWGKQLRLFVTLPPSMPLPLRSGASLIVDYFAVWDERSSGMRRALALRDDTGELLLAFQDRVMAERRNLLPDDLLPDALRLRSGPRVAYWEAGLLDGLCYAVSEHYTMRLGEDPESPLVQPGEYADLAGRDASYRAMVIDNARSQDPKSTCRSHRTDRFAWLAVRLPRRSSP